MSRESSRIAYVIIGDVAVINVKRREEVYSEETLAKAREILARHKRVRAVYAKIETSGEFRVQNLIHIIGEKVSETWHRENGIYFHVSLGKVYINPRLATEHLRIAKLLDECGCKKVLDAFAGIGGYAFTIAVYANAEQVVANDLNPYAARDMVLTASRNRSRLKAHTTILNVDAALLPSILRKRSFDAIILDNPHYIDRYLNIVCPLASREHILAVYFISLEGEEEDRAQALISALKCSKCEVVSLRPVIDYAPRKYLYSLVLRCTHLNIT